VHPAKVVGRDEVPVGSGDVNKARTLKAKAKAFP